MTLNRVELRYFESQ